MMIDRHNQARHRGNRISRTQEDDSDDCMLNMSSLRGRLPGMGRRRGLDTTEGGATHDGYGDRPYGGVED